MRSALLLFLLALIPSFPLLARDAAVGGEIEFLLKYVEGANVRFIRNGAEYGPKEAADHLRQKLSSAGERVKTAEDFIEGLASKSSVSGKPYLIKTADGKIVPAAEWLGKALAEHRKAGH